MEMTSNGDPPRPAKTGPSAGQLIRDAAGETTAHAIPRIFSNRHPVKKALWLLAFLVGLGAAAYYISNSVNKYLSHPFNVNVVYEEMSVSDNFPDITVCNLNYYRRTKIDPIKTRVGTACDWTKSYYSYFQCLAANADAAELENLGYPLQDMLYYCDVDYEPCDYTNFTRSEQVNGNSFCYTFNIRGRPAAVTLGLYVDSYEYTQSDRTGISVMLHAHGQDSSHGFSAITAGKSTTISFEGVSYKRLKLPYSQECLDTEKWKPSVLDSSTPYSIPICYQDCQLKALAEGCRCYSAEYIGMVEAARLAARDGLTLCELTQANRNCATVQASDVSAQCTHICRSPCRENTYDIKSLASIEWPASGGVINRRHETLKYVPQNIGLLLNDSYPDLYQQCYDQEWQCENFFRSNMMRLKLRWSGYTKITVNADPSYELTQLISDIGGLGGLYIGISLLSICELIELLWDLCTLPCARRRRTASTTSIGDRQMEKL